MHSKTVYFLLALSVMVALVTAIEDEDDDLFDMMFGNEMEKRKGGRRQKGKNKGGACPGKPNCYCAFRGDGSYIELACAPTGRGGQVGL